MHNTTPQPLLFLKRLVIQCALYVEKRFEMRHLLRVRLIVEEIRYMILFITHFLKGWLKFQSTMYKNKKCVYIIDSLSLLQLSSNSTPISAGVINSGSAGSSPVAAKAIRGSDIILPAPYSATNLKWLHTSPICSLTAEQGQRTVRNLLTARNDEDATQDNSVSSTIDTPELNMDSVPCQPPPGKISAPCLERLLKSTESIINHKASRGTSDMGSSTMS